MQSRIRIMRERVEGWGRFPLAVVFRFLGVIPKCLLYGEATWPVNLRLSSWDADDGLPQNTIAALAQTTDGYLWIGTRFGIARFDGVRFEVWNQKNTPALASHTVRSMAAGPDAVLWIGTSKGLYRVKEGRLRRFGLKQGLLDELILQIEPSRDGAIWILSGSERRHVSRLQDGRIQRFDHPEITEYGVKQIHEGFRGELIVVSPRGGMRLDGVDGAYREMKMGEAGHEILSLARGLSGGYWISQRGGLFHQENGTGEFIPYPGELAGETFYETKVDPEGAVWLSGENALARYGAGRWTIFRVPDAAENANYTGVLVDREGSVWFGTRKTGLHRIRFPDFQCVSARDGLIHDSVWSVCERRRGGFWAGTGGGLSRVAQGRLRNYSINDGLPRRWILTVCERRNGDVVMGMRTGERREPANAPFVARLRAGKIVPLYQGQIGETRRVWTVMEDRWQRLWIGTSNGVYHESGSGLERYGAEQGLSHPDIRTIVEDREGGLWMGSNGGGIYRFRDGKVVARIDRENGLSHNNAWSIHLDEDQVLWVGTEYGLNRIDAGHLTRYSSDDGLFDDLVNQILEDDYGNLWLSCNRGISRVSKQELHDFSLGRRARIRSVSYGKPDGMLSSETNGECQPAGCKLSDGRLLFPTARGVVVIDPRRLLARWEPALPVIESVRANGKIFWTNGPESGGSSRGRREEAEPERGPDPARGGFEWILPPGSGHALEIRFTANTFIESDKVAFRYRLKGHDKGWVDAGRRRSAFYSNLSPGRYELEVASKDIHSVWSETANPIVLEIQAHFYETYTFYGAALFGMAGVIFGVHRFVLRHRLQLERLESQLAVHRERSRIARDLHDEMGSALTYLNHLGGFAENIGTDSKVLDQLIRRVQRRSRDLVASVDEIVWATNPKHDVLESVVTYFSRYAQEFFESTGIRCRIDMPLPMDLPESVLRSQVRHQLFLAFKEALTNVVKHARTTAVWIRGKVKPGRFILVIEDQGKGFSQEFHGRPDHDGLSNMRRRLREMGGQAAIESRSEDGTVVTLSVPLHDGGIVSDLPGA